MLSSALCEIPKYLSDYVTVKYALLGLVRSISKELCGTNASICGIAPPMVDTPFLSEQPGIIVREAKESGKMVTAKALNPLLEKIFFTNTDINGEIFTLDYVG